MPPSRQEKSSIKRTLLTCARIGGYVQGVCYRLGVSFRVLLNRALVEAAASGSSRPCRSKIPSSSLITPHETSGGWVLDHVQLVRAMSCVRVAGEAGGTRKQKSATPQSLHVILVI